MAIHESVDLACEMEANPANLTFIWHFETEDANGNVVMYWYASDRHLECGSGLRRSNINKNETK
jgi:hypothetical protein